MGKIVSAVAVAYGQRPDVENPDSRGKCMEEAVHKAINDGVKPDDTEVLRKIIASSRERRPQK